MHKATVLPIIIIAAVVIGGLLYLYGGPAFHQTYTNTVGNSGSLLQTGGPNMTVLAQDVQAPNADERVNYRVTNEDQLAALWQMIYTDNGTPVPSIDFNKYEVLAVFDGSHSTAGYSVAVASVKDTSSARVVTIVHTEPGDSCVPGGGGTSPFVIIQVSKTSLPISRVDQTVTTQCQ